MSTDLDATRSQREIPGGIHQSTIRHPVAVSSDFAARYVRGRGVDAREIEGRAADHRAVAAGMHHVHGATRGRPVEVGGCGVAAFGELALVVAVGPQRGSRLELGGAAREELDQRIDGRGALRADIGPGGGLPEHQRVDMGIHESRDERTTAEVALLMTSSRDSAAVSQRACVQDAIPADRNGLDTLGIGHGQDRSAGDDQRIRISRSTGLHPQSTASMNRRVRS